MWRLARWWRFGLLAAFVLLVLVEPSFAQDDEDKQRWYDVPVLPQKKVWVPWLMAFLFALGCVGLAFKNPHRSHLD